MKHDAKLDAAREEFRAELRRSGRPTSTDYDRTAARHGLPWCAISPVAGIAVATAHGVPVALAVAIGVLVAGGYLGLALRWNPAWPWRWIAVGALTVVTFYPGLVWWPWAVLAVFLAYIPLAIWLMATKPRRSEFQMARRLLAEGEPPRGKVIDQ